MKEYILKLQRKENLSQGEIEAIMQEIMSGKSHKEDIAAFLLSLRAKGATVEEITGAAKIMRKFVVPIKTKHQHILDTCGTGGDKKNTFNISTITALVVASGGCVVAKHGNRSMTSKCGSACLLESLGVNLEVEEAKLSECLDKIGIAFLFAQKLHPAMKNVAPIRRELGVETIFNILGPLTNPAKATHQMMGVYSRDLVEPMAEVLKNLGLKRSLVVHGADGLDEITTTTQSFIGEYTGKELRSYDFSPEELGIPLAKPDDLTGGDVERNTHIARQVLDGESGPKRDIVVLNAAFAFYTAQKVDNILDGIHLASECLDQKKAKSKLAELIEFTNK